MTSPALPSSVLPDRGGDTRTGRLLALGLLWVLLLGAWPAAAGETPNVLVSIKPIHSLVAGIMEGVADPGLIATERSPLELEITPQWRDRLAAADLIIWVGPELEPALAGVLRDPAMQPRALELLAQQRLKLLPARSGDGGRDPYLWMDTRNMLILLDELTRVLSDADPARGHRYEANRQKLLGQLTQVDRELEYRYKSVSSKPVFLYHDTQQYFEQAYAMKVAGIAASPAGSSPAVETLLRLGSALSREDSPCLFTEAALPAPHLDILLARGTTRVVELDSLGSRLPPGPDLYPRLMREHYRLISECAQPGVQPGAPVSTDQSPFALFPHRIQGRYLLMNQFGETVSNLDFRGRYQLVYFGYTFCPDICPTSLVSLAKALEILGPRADRIQPILITVDPARDTPEVLRTYTAYFHPRLLGLTGPEEMIARTAEQFRVRYEKVTPEGGDPNRYSMDHTASLFLLGPESEFVAKFAHGLPAAELAARLGELIAD